MKKESSESLLDVGTFTTAIIVSVEKEILMIVFIVDKPSVNWSLK